MTRAWIVLAACAAWGAEPDRPALPDEWGYRPTPNATVAVNPPSLSWVHEKDAAGYSVQWAANADFRSPATVDGIPWSVYTHHEPLAAGTWWWRYRITNRTGQISRWSAARSFTIRKDATVFPQPTLDQLRQRIGAAHPRLFIRESDRARLRQLAQGEGAADYRRLIAAADKLIAAEPTPEPTVRGSNRDPQTRDHWWSNRVQTLKALQEAELLTFAWWLTGDQKYAANAKRFTLLLAGWDPDGPTNFALNCEAAKPMLHRLARAYDWGYALFNDEERAHIRAVLLRRAKDAWKSGEVREGAGHLNQPYNSHGNRTWHKLAENAVATLGETPEADLFLRYATAKFFAAYPVWSDDDGGWHEGLSYLGGYMVKTTWWLDLASQALGIDGFQKPFFARIGDYALYSAPPGTPDLGFGDLSFRPPSGGWSFLHYYARRMKNPYWTWWLEQWKVGAESSEPVLDVLRAAPAVAAKAPSSLPPSKLFAGTGVAVLNTNLSDGRDNVQIRFKASPMGRVSHGHDAQNSITLNAYGAALLVNNVYRDIYGSPFHAKWTWTTQAQNALLVNGEGQKPHAMDAAARIVQSQFSDGFDFVSGDALPSYEGRLQRARRHVYFLKPDVILIVDDVAAPAPAKFQVMLHGQKEFAVDAAAQRLRLENGPAAVAVDYVSSRPLALRQWTGYNPEPDWAYLKSVNSAGIPPQWHVEAATPESAADALLVTVLQVYRPRRGRASAQGCGPQHRSAPRSRRRPLPPRREAMERYDRALIPATRAC